MEFNEELNKIEDEARMKAEEQARANALVDLAKKPVEIVKAAVSNNIVQKLKDPDVKERMDNSTDKLIDSGLETVENEADSAKNKSETEKLKTYFEQHKEELKTAGIDEPTYMEDMERGVKCHRKWSDVHWKLFGWWQTGIRTFIQKAKPFKIWLNSMAIILCLAVTGASIWGIIELIKLIV